MPTSLRSLCVGCLIVVVLAFNSQAEEPLDLLARHCVTCHNPSDPKAGLDLSQATTALQGSDSGPVVLPGKPAESLLLGRVTDGSMPPEHDGRRLTPAEVATLKAWIAGGAAWPEGRRLSQFEFTTDRRAGFDWWSLQPLRTPPLPPANQFDRQAVDAFVYEKLSAVNLGFSAPADRRTLVRRAFLDLLGLPPAPVETEAFVADPAPDAFEQLLDRLLASPHYGERWGRHWLDVVRYGESDGFEHDKYREHAWPYRDYVIRSLNADKPYADFIIEQLAGDALPGASREQIAATGFLVAGPWDEIQNVGASSTEKRRAREEQQEELIAAVSQTFLGLTVHCARCHDHKFDPIPQTDYYQLKAALDGIDHGLRPWLTAEEQRSWELAQQPLQEALARIKAKLVELRPMPGQTQPCEQIASLQAEQQQIEAQLKERKPPQVYAGTRREPGPTHLLIRGDPTKPGPQIAPGILTAVRTSRDEWKMPANLPEAERRLKLARWIAHQQNPLPWRVMANRLWHHHFGRGLVATTSDFGFSGGRPSHPELLDHLASELRRTGSLKSLHRQLMLSRTYRQTSLVNDPAHLQRAARLDADNRLLWRFAPRRLEAEAVRDAMLAVSGQLNSQQGGPGFKPFTVTVFNTHFYHLFDSGRPEFNRRSIYQAAVVTGRSPLLTSLDCPAPSLATPQRQETVTPLQSLGLMNDSFVQRQAAALADRVTQAHPGSVSAQVDHLYALSLSREPSAAERVNGCALIEGHSARELAWALLNSSEFLFQR